MMADMLLHGYVYMQAGMVVDMMGCNMCMDGCMEAPWQGQWCFVVVGVVIMVSARLSCM